MLIVEGSTWIMFSKNRHVSHVYYYLVLWEARYPKRKKKKGSLLNLKLVNHGHNLVLRPSQECLLHRHIVLRFSNIGFDKYIFQHQFSLLLTPPALLPARKLEEKLYTRICCIDMKKGVNSWCYRQSKLSITWFCFTLSKVKVFSWNQGWVDGTQKTVEGG